MDGRPFALRGDPEERPYVPNPILPCPNGPTSWTGVEKSLRPACLWAAMHFASTDHLGRRHAVMISITQNIATFLEDLLTLLDDTWRNKFFQTFSHLRQARVAFGFGDQCASATICIGRDSYEYRLLNKGIVVHHSSMPKVLTRLIIEVVNSGICSVVVGTSGLSEGINLPVETVLVPSILRRGTFFLSASSETWPGGLVLPLRGEL